ncbi:MAG: Phytochrome-like protein cph2 [Syntrophorhabdus sp. PtaU1.Bin153]|nr:MAG: Phytochrome-like protein cph2 [Syntrophorhabdus sp. PtaU1.Bin153]
MYTACSGENKEVESTRGSHIPSEKPVVLVVDDDAVARLVTGANLEQAGFAVSEAENGEEGLKAFVRLRPDIVVSDVLMPHMDGFAFCQSLRLSPEGKHVPFLMVTGLEDTESVQRAYEVGATDFISKPFNWLIFCERIKYMLRASRLGEEVRISEAKNRALLNAIPDSMFRISKEGIFIEAREAKTGHLHERVGQAVGKSVYEILPVGVAQTVFAAVTTALDHNTVEAFEFQIMDSGTLRDLDSRIVASGDSEALAIIRDITERKKAEMALRESEERYALATRGANDGLWDWDRKTNQVYFSERWKAILGCAGDEIGSSPEEWLKRIHPEDEDQVNTLLNAHVQGISPHFEAEHRIMHKDGTYRWVLTRGLAVRDDEGKPYRMAGSLSDITDRKYAQDQLRHDALYDPLTGLPNRALFVDRLEHALRRRARSETPDFAVLFLDLDRFKQINDSLGHGAGDRVLMATARRLESCVRPGDTVARIGGDEFVILLENIRDVKAATGVAQRVEMKLTVPYDVEGRQVFCPASIGIALADNHYEKPEDILRDADIAVYKAKALGRARHAVFDQDMYQKAVALLELETDLRRAVERQEFILYYQPIVALDTGSLVSLEALIRWRHPRRGIILPEEFIPLAEDTGLILPIGEWVLESVCRQIKAWRQSGCPVKRVAVNVSGRQLRQEQFADMVAGLLTKYELSPDVFELEITETVLMENLASAGMILNQLAEAGIRVNLDDFGTGYSSLNYLQQFPVQKLKIDRAFVSGIGLQDEDTKIVQAVLNLAKGLGIEVVAEGIETEQTALRLRAMGCQLGQGFFFQKPAGPEHFERVIAHEGQPRPVSE